MLFYVQLCLFLSIFSTKLQCLIFNSNLSDESVFLKQIFPKLPIIFSVCMRYKPASEKFQSVIEMFFWHNIPIVFESGNEHFSRECRNFLFYEVQSAHICDSFSRNKYFYLTSYFSVIIVPDINFNVKILENCVDIFDSANVFLISLQNEEVLFLSSPTSPSRVFLSKNLSLSFNSNVKDLQGQAVRVATFHYPPFTTIETDNTSGQYVIYQCWVVAHYFFCS